MHDKMMQAENHFLDDVVPLPFSLALLLEGGMRKRKLPLVLFSMLRKFNFALLVHLRERILSGLEVIRAL